MRNLQGVIALAIPFVLVQVAGEALHVAGLPLAITQASYALVVLVTIHRFSRGVPRFNGSIDRAVAAFALALVLAIVIGFIGGADPARLREDIAPLAFMLLTYVAARALVRTPRAVGRMEAAIVVGSLAAALKLAYLAVVPVPAGWDSAWQASRLAEYGSVRIILRGADVFFVVTPLLVLARALAQRRIRVGGLIAGGAAMAAMVVSGTRSNWVGFLSGAVAIVLASSWLPRTRFRVWSGTALAAAVLLMVVASSDATERAITGLAHAARERAWTIDMRAFETEGVAAAIAETGGLGNGMGSTFHYWDIEQQRVLSTGFTHNGYLHLLMKTGWLGLAAFLLVAFRSARAMLLAIRDRGEWGTQLLGVYGATIAILVLSITVNKLFILSGAMFLGLAFATAQSSAAEAKDIAT